jgi:hypothetical protein
MAGENASLDKNQTSLRRKKFFAGMSIMSPAVRLTDGGEEMDARVIVAVARSASHRGRMINQLFLLNR